jgi:DNA modification methylase
MINTEQTLEYIPTALLIPYARNSRTHSENQIKQVANSITEFGFTNPVLIDSYNGIIAGHGRVKAAQLLCLELVPCLRLGHLSEAQKRAYIIADNQLALNSGWDEDLLRAELLDLQGIEFDMDLLGFDMETLEDLLFIEPERDNSKEDDVPEPPADPVSKLGDVWLLGKHLVMCGDSTNIEDVEMLMNGKKADMVFTDPPYGVSYADKNAYLNAVAPANRIQVSIEGDHQSIPEMKELWLAAFTNLATITTDKASYYITGPQGGELMMMMMMMIDESGWQLKHMLIWAKNNHVLGRCDYHYKHEPILFGWKKKGTHEFYGSSSNFSLWEINKPQKSDLHPTMKPVELVERAILNSSKKQNCIIDLFLGSGTTLIAAEKTNRICYGLEISPAYVDVICQRWQTYTNQQAIHEATGQTFDELFRGGFIRPVANKFAPTNG